MLGSLLLTLLVPFCPVPDTLDPAPIVRVDSSRHEITVTVGPFNLHTMPPAEDGVMDHGATHNSPVQHFAWPVEGWLRGFRFEVLDGEAEVVDAAKAHAAIVVGRSRGGTRTSSTRPYSTASAGVMKRSRSMSSMTRSTGRPLCREMSSAICRVVASTSRAAIEMSLGAPRKPAEP